MTVGLPSTAYVFDSIVANTLSTESTTFLVGTILNPLAGTTLTTESTLFLITEIGIVPTLMPSSFYINDNS